MRCSLPAMTLPLFLALHMLYGVLAGRAVFQRMRVEEEVLGGPMFAASLPVFLLSAPIGVVLLRYAGGWFLHGALLRHWVFETYHVGLAVALVLFTGGVYMASLLWSLVFASRLRDKLEQAPLYVAGLVVVSTLVVDARGVWHVLGTDRVLSTHPVGLLSLGAVLLLAGSVVLLQRRFAVDPRAAT
jgi:hypothetical protein